MKWFVALPFFIACSDEPGARRLLEAQGFTKIETTGYSVFGCSKDDEVTTGFRATSPSGSRVEGAVCCGLLFKACTVRFE